MELMAPAAETPILSMPMVGAMEPPAEPPGDAKAVEDALLKFDWENVQLGKQIMQQVLADADRDKRVYDALPQLNERKAEDQEQDPKTPECATQSDMIRAQYNVLLFQSSDTFKAQAKQSADQPKADTSISLIKDIWHDYGMELEIDASLWDFLNSPYCGLKTVVHAKTEPVAVNYEVPFNDQSIFDFEQGMRAKRQPFQIIGQDEDKGVVVYEAIELRTTQDCVGEAIDPTRLYLTSRKVSKIKDVPSCHYSNVWDYETIEAAAGFRNLDKLGEPNANGRVRPTDQVPNQEDIHGQENYTNGNFEYWEIWETWGCVPWGKWLKKGAFTYQDLEAFAERYGFDIFQCGFYDDEGNWINNNQKWRRYHKTQETYLQFATSYLFDKTQYPYHIGSFIAPRRELIGSSYISRVSDWENMIHAASSMLADNVRFKLYQSVIANALSGLDKKKWQDLFKRKGYVEVELNGMRVEDQIRTSGELIDDMTQGGLAYLNFALGQFKSYGLPDIQMGSGNSETATQDSINLEKSTAKVTHPLRRYMHGVLIPCVEQIRDFNHQNFAGERWIASQAEAGASIAKEERPVTRKDLTNRFRIISTVTYDYASRPAKLNHMLALLNIGASVPFMTPEAFFSLLSAVMEMMELPREMIDAVTNNEGRGTEPDEEIRTMRDNKWAKPKVRPDDDHIRALLTLTQAVDEMNMKAPGAGFEFAGQDNVKSWSSDHLYYFEQQQAALEQQAALAAAEAGPKGKPNQRPNSGPQDHEGEARQGAQHNSPADNAPPGMTGQASVAAMQSGNMSTPGTGL